jgi:nucleoside-diphosphate-sugar epimerase
MALFKLTKAVMANEKIKVFNYGKHRRDFIYIDDIVEGVIRVLIARHCAMTVGAVHAPVPVAARLLGELITSATIARLN